MKDLNAWTRKELLALPDRAWNTKSIYSSILILSSRLKHETGWAKMIVIGINGGQPLQVVSRYSDDIGWLIRTNGVHALVPELRTDCLLNSGAIHMWGHCQFEVGTAGSSLDIIVRRVDDVVKRKMQMKMNLRGEDE